MSDVTAGYGKLYDLTGLFRSFHVLNVISSINFEKLCVSIHLDTYLYVMAEVYRWKASLVLHMKTMKVWWDYIQNSRDVEYELYGMDPKMAFRL